MTNECADPAGAAGDEGPTGRFEGTEGFARAVTGTIVEACARGDESIILCSPDFAGWPLGRRVVVEALGAWARGPGRKRQLALITAQYDTIERESPLWVAWRRRWDACVACWAVDPAEVPELPAIAWTPRRVVLELDALHRIGLDTSEARRIASAREQLDELLRRASPAFPATTLGL